MENLLNDLQKQPPEMFYEKEMFTHFNNFCSVINTPTYKLEKFLELF